MSGAGGRLVALAVAALALAAPGCGGGDRSVPADADRAAPPAPGLSLEPGGLEAKHLYMGVSCAAGNRIGCDGIAVSVEVPDEPDFVVAIVAGRRIRLDRISNRSKGPFVYQGRLEVPGLLHEGPLAVDPMPNGKWLGQPRVSAPVLLQAVNGDVARYAERRFDDVWLAPGFG